MSAFSLSTSTSSSTSSSATESTTTVPPQPSTDEGLSTGAKGGVGVGAAIGVLILLVVGALFVRGVFRRRRSAELDGGSGWSQSDTGGGKEKALHASQTAELGDGSYHELDGRQVRAEVQG